MNQNEVVQSIVDMVELQITNIHTAAPGRIISYDSATGLASVQPSLKRKFPDGRVMDFPIIIGVPVIFPATAGGTASVTLPIKAGDGCLLLFAERSIDEWLKGGESDDPRAYDLTDAIAIPGLYRCAVGGAIAHPDDLVLAHGKTTLRIPPEGPVVLSGADFIVDGISFKAHVHPESIGSQTGPPK